MFRIKPAQIEVLAERNRQQEVEEITKMVYGALRKNSPEVLQGRSHEEAIESCRRVVQAARRYRVIDFVDVCQWAYIRFVSSVEFYDLPQFRYFLDEPLIHPKVKARNIAISYKLAAQGRA